MVGEGNDREKTNPSREETIWYLIANQAANQAETTKSDVFVEKVKNETTAKIRENMNDINSPTTLKHYKE